MFGILPPLGPDFLTARLPIEIWNNPDDEMERRLQALTQTYAYTRPSDGAEVEVEQWFAFKAAAESIGGHADSRPLKRYPTGHSPIPGTLSTDVLYVLASIGDPSDGASGMALTQDIPHDDGTSFYNGILVDLQLPPTNDHPSRIGLVAPVPHGHTRHVRGVNQRTDASGAELTLSTVPSPGNPTGGQVFEARRQFPVISGAQVAYLYAAPKEAADTSDTTNWAHPSNYIGTGVPPDWRRVIIQSIADSQTVPATKNDGDLSKPKHHRWLRYDREEGQNEWTWAEFQAHVASKNNFGPNARTTYSMVYGWNTSPGSIPRVPEEI